MAPSTRVWHLQLQATALQFGAIIFVSAYIFASRRERLSVITHCAPAPLHACSAVLRQNTTRGIQVARRRNAWVIVENESHLFVARQRDWISLRRWRGYRMRTDRNDDPGSPRQERLVGRLSKRVYKSIAANFTRNK